MFVSSSKETEFHNLSSSLSTVFRFTRIRHLSTSTTTKKKKSYANERVQLAAEKEREKAERMAQDEAERQAELQRMKQEEAK